MDPLRLSEEPKLGEIRKGRELGYSHNNQRIWARCPDCGKERWVELIRGKAASTRCRQCAPKHSGRTGEANPNWKGGRWIRAKDGYVMVQVSPNDFFYPMAAKSTGTVLEHRLIMAKHLKRCLLPWEVVHHKNGIRDDNRLENLQLLRSGKYHLVDNMTKRHISQLENKIDQLLEKQDKLLTEVRLLRFENQQLRERI